MTSSRSHRLIRLGALASVLLAMGCPSVTVETQAIIPTTVVKPASLGTPSPVGSGVTGKVTGVGGAAVASAHMYLTDARIIEVTNSPEGTSDGSGAYDLRPVPGTSPWFVVAEANGTREANIFKPTGKASKDASCDVSMASTLACAGVAPYFIDDPAHPENTIYLLSDLNVDRFNALVTAVAADLPADAKPSAKLHDLNAPFVTLMGKDAAVKAAFDALINDVKAQASIRAAGGTPQPLQSGAVLVKTSTSPTASSGVSLQGSAAPSPSLAPGASPTASSGQPATTNPIPTTTPNATVLTVGKTNAPAHVTIAPDGSSFTFLEGTAIANVQASSFVVLPGATPPTFTDNTAIQAKYATFDPGDSGPYYLAGNTIIHGSRTVTLSGVDPSAPYALVVKGTTGYISLFNQNYIGRVDLSQDNPTVSALAGSVNRDNNWADGTGTSALMAVPQGMCMAKGMLYFCDTYNNMIRKIDPATGVVTTIAGQTTSGQADGTGLSATFAHPADITTDDTGTNLYIADQNNHSVRKLVIATGVVTTIAGKAHQPDDNGNDLHYPQGIAWGKVSLPLGTQEVLLVTETNSTVRGITGW